MKRNFSLLICLILILALAGCGDSSSSGKPVSNQPAGVNDVLQQGMAEADNKVNNNSQPEEDSNSGSQQITENEETPTPEHSAKPNPTSKPDSSADVIDVDLTVLSSTMVYSEVYNMMVTPEDYIGKTVKMKGQYAVFHDETTGNYYFACIIQDATACCAQGIEFVLTKDYTYPDDYPEADAEICVVGVFDTYQEGEYTYCTLRNASLL